jgi:hypothetical protein
VVSQEAQSHTKNDISASQFPESRKRCATTNLQQVMFVSTLKHSEMSSRNQLSCYNFGTCVADAQQYYQETTG